MKVLILLAAISLASAWPWEKKQDQQMQNDGVEHHYYYKDVNHYGSKGRGEEGPEERQETPKKNKANYYFALGDDMGAFEFIDEKGGLQGFHVELINTLCDLGGYNCYYVMTKYKDCWTTQGDREYPGVGLLANWFTACMGYWPYPRRLNSFNFTMSYAKPQKASTFWLASRNDDFKDKASAKGLKIGFIDGWSTSKFCLARQLGDSVDDFEAIMYNTHDDMVDALKSKKIDVFLSTKEGFTYGDELTAGDEYDCNYDNRGPAFMLKYGSPALELLNRGLEIIYNDGTYQKLCNRVNMKYGSTRGRIDCLD